MSGKPPFITRLVATLLFGASIASAQEPIPVQDCQLARIFRSGASGDHFGNSVAGPGDVNGDFEGPDISDLVYLVTYMFSGGQAPPWPSWRANVNGDFTGPDISDLVYLVTYMFSSGPPPKSAPTWPIY